MSINETYRTWIQRICELRPKQRKTQVQNFVWLLVGMFHSRSVSLSKVAGKVMSTAKNMSTVRRLSRFLASSAVDVRSWYRSTAKAWLVAQAQQVGEIQLIVDGTKIGFGYQLLMVSLAYRHRAVPIAWAWIRHVRGHSSAAKQIVLLKYVRSLISQNLSVAFLYVWLLSVGSRTIRSGLRHFVDRKDRRDLSLFQIGLRFIDRCLLLSLSFSLPLSTR